MKSLLDRIPVESVEKMKLYRLGVFGDRSIELVELKAGQDYPPHFHRNSKTIFCMIVGEGLIILDGKEQKYSAGKTFRINKSIRHGFKPGTDTLFLSIQTPPIKDRKTGKEDIHF